MRYLGSSFELGGGEGRAWAFSFPFLVGGGVLGAGAEAWGLALRGGGVQGLSPDVIGP